MLKIVLKKGKKELKLQIPGENAAEARDMFDDQGTVNHSDLELLVAFVPKRAKAVKSFVGGGTVTITFPET